MLRVVDADCWGFQELWHKDAIHAVFKQSGKLKDYELLIPEGHTGQRIVSCGAACKKHLVGELEWIDSFREKLILQTGGDDVQSPDIYINIEVFSRPLLLFNIKPRANGEVIHVFITH